MDGFVKFVRSTWKPEINTGTKLKTQVHDHHPTEMFNNHLYSHKHKQSLVTNQNIKAMLSKGNIKAQITTAIKSSSVETKESN